MRPFSLASRARLLLLFVLGVALSLGLASLAACGREDLTAWDLPDAASERDGGADAVLDAPADARGDAPDGAPDGGTLVSLDITPPKVTVPKGTTAKLRATGAFSDGTTSDLTTVVAWTSDVPATATVNAGVVTGVAPGTTTVHATFGGKIATATVTVPTAPIKSIVVTPLFATTGVGGSVTFTASATLTDGTTLDVTSSAAWTSSAPGVATMAANVATGVAAGKATITAAVGAISGKAQLTVSGTSLVSIAITPTNPVVGVGVGFAFTAIGTYSDGSIADLTATATWTSSAPGTLFVGANGQAKSLMPGTSIVTAQVGSVTGQTTVTVTAATLVSIAVTPATSTLPVNGTEPLTATGTYSDGTTFDLTQTVTWGSGAPQTAQVSNAAGSKGTVSGIAPGMATITATLGGVSGQATVTVEMAKLVSIAISPADPRAPIGTTVAFTATATYDNGQMVDVTTSAGWSTDDPTIASIANAPTAGVATANALGTTGVHATLNGITGSTTITVTAATITSITVTPATSTLAVTQKELLRATGNYSDGTATDVTALAVWTSASTSVVTVSNAPGAQGQVTATGAGTTSVTATLNGVSGSASVTVQQATLAQISVSPIAPSAPVGQRIQFQAIAIFTNGTQQNVTAMAQWTSSDPNVAPINGTGRATTQAPGTTTITAAYQGSSGSTTLTVTSAVAVSLQVSPVNPTYPAGTTQQFQATAIYSDNTSQNVTQQATWQSSDANVAGVTTGGGGRGRVTTIAAGTAVISASWNGLSGSSTVTVSSAVVVSISVSPASWSDVVGASHPFTAQAIYSDNTSRDVTAQATWVSSAPQIVGVNDANQRGLATAIAPGTATLTATYQGVSGSATFDVTGATVTAIEVTPIAPSVAAGTPVRFQATAIFSDNTSQNVTAQATWTSSTPSVAQVSDAAGTKGEAQTFAAGQTTIAATWQGVTGSTTLTVTAATLVQIQVTPFSPTVPVGFTTQLTATGVYSDNTTQDVTALATWTSSAPSVAAVSDAAGSKGRVSPLAPGTATITATYQGVQGTDAFTVSSATLQSIAVSPPSATIGVGATQQYAATGTLSDGSMLDVTTYVTWLSSTPAIASISNAGGSQGQAKGLSSGTVTITAVRSSVSGTASLTVQ